MIGTVREKAWMRGSFRYYHEQERLGPLCEDESLQLKGHLTTPGLAEISVFRSHAKFVRQGPPGEGCSKRGFIPSARATVRGHNGKPLETELIR
jgi:hypothetical protein